MIGAVAREVATLVRPMLNVEKEQDDPIFTIDELKVYLRVPKGWLYERTRLREIPFFKMGKFIRFRKSEIDAWIKGLSSPATAPAPSRLKMAR